MKTVMGLYVDVPNMEDDLLRTWDVTVSKLILQDILYIITMIYKRMDEV